MRYIYCNYYKDGSLYVGRHTWEGDGIDPNYQGSSQVANRLGLELDKIEILEICTEENINAQEHYWITYYATLYGIDSRVHPNAWTIKFKHGRLLNGHCNDLVNAQYLAETKEARAKAVRTMKAKGLFGKSLAIRQSKTDEYRESMRKSAETRRLLYGSAISEKCKQASHLIKKRNPDREFGEKSVIYHEKSVNSRILNNSYKTGAMKVSIAIKGRPHFMSKPIECTILSTGEILKFSKIKDAEEYFDKIGEHITRATISQGLKRTEGAYIYKRRYKFTYGGK